MGGRAGADGTLLFKDDDHTYAGGNPRGDIVTADPLAGLDHLAREVRAAGIKAVTGAVIIDDRLFDTTESTEAGRLLGKLCELFYASDGEGTTPQNSAPSQAGHAKSSTAPRR